jgi:hypothetical protein
LNRWISYVHFSYYEFRCLHPYPLEVETYFSWFLELNGCCFLETVEPYLIPLGSFFEPLFIPIGYILCAVFIPIGYILRF